MFTKNDTNFVSTFSWTAIFVGAFTIVSLSFLLHLLLASLGVSAFYIAEAGKSTFFVFGFLALMILSIGIMFCGGWVTGYLAQDYVSTPYLGSLHGFTAWSLALLITIILAAQTGRFVADYHSMVSGQPFALETSSGNESFSQPTSINSEQIRIPLPIDKDDRKTAAISSFSIISMVTFILFTLGALSSTFGGRKGMQFKKQKNIDFNVKSTHC